MEVVTSDDVYVKVSDEFIQRSRLLKDMDPGKVHVPFPDSVIQHLIRDEFPKNGQSLLEVARAADFLNMESELDQACRRIASTIRGKTPQEIEKFLNHAPS